MLASAQEAHLLIAVFPLPTAVLRPLLACYRSFERLLFSIEQAWWHYEVRQGAWRARWAGGGSGRG